MYKLTFTLTEVDAATGREVASVGKTMSVLDLDMSSRPDLILKDHGYKIVDRVIEAVPLELDK